MALSTGCSARFARLIDFGVTARFTARPGWVALRTDRGTSILVKNPIARSIGAPLIEVKRLGEPLDWTMREND
jgi:hypothetical protein